MLLLTVESPVGDGQAVIGVHAQRASGVTSGWATEPLIAPRDGQLDAVPPSCRQPVHVARWRWRSRTALLSYMYRPRNASPV